MPLPSQRACTSVLPSLSLALASAPASIRSAMSLALQTREAACRMGGFAPYRPLTEAPAFNRRLTIATTSSSSPRSEEHTSELQSPCNLVCRLLLEKKKNQSPAIHQQRS